jgi:hypothetical protein
MAGVRIVVDAIEAEQKNAEGGRTITVSGRTSSKPSATARLRSRLRPT